MPLRDKRIECTLPGCGKLFTRKEHLNRHLKSHAPQREHLCHICGRRYARSDVLKRHIEIHSQGLQPTAAFAPCFSCHQHNLKCDDCTPCQACTRSSTECARVTPVQKPRVGIEFGLSSGDSDSGDIGNDQAPTSASSNIGTVLPIHGQQQHLAPSTDDIWSHSLNFTGLDVSFPVNGSPHDMEQWVMYPSEGGGHGDPTSATLSDSSLFPLPRTEGSQTYSSRNASWHSLSQGHKSASSSSAVQTPASSQTEDVVDLRSCLDRDSQATYRLVLKYFADVHTHWPILHVPSFEVSNTPHLLLASMIGLASWIERTSDHLKLAPLIYDELIATLLGSKASFDKGTRPASLQTLQALLLYCVYTTCRLATDGASVRAVHLHGLLISNCRQLGVFTGQYADYSLEDRPFAFWLVQEQLHRLAYAVLRVDTYFSILADYPPSVRYQEICIPLPKSTHLWSATSEDERRKLQWNEPAGREKARFCYLMRDALDFTHGRHLPGFLTAEDYHLGLCSYQAGTWEAAHKAHSSESDELITNALPREHVQIWRSQLDFWYFSLTSNNQPEQEYSGITTVSDADGIFTPLSLILWHLSSLTLYAPVRFLQSQCSTDRITPKDKTRLRDWVASPCARTAVRNAAQICRVVEDESSSPAVTTRLLLNPLVVPGILKSAIITTLYAHYSLTCSKCTGMSPVDLVDLFNTDDEDTRLVNWMEHGNGLATWGPSEIAICRCRVLELSDWFRCAVRASKRAEIEILAFVATLDKGYLPLRDLS